MSAESDEKIKETIEALRRERESQQADHAAIDKELRRLGVNSAGPREKAQRRGKR